MKRSELTAVPSLPSSKRSLCNLSELCMGVNTSLMSSILPPFKIFSSFSESDRNKLFY